MNDQEGDKALYLAFKKATKNITTLYRLSDTAIDQANSLGYQDALRKFVKLYKGLNQRMIRLPNSNIICPFINGEELLRRMIANNALDTLMLEREESSLSQMFQPLDTPREFKRHMELISTDILDDSKVTEIKKKIRRFRKKSQDDDSIF